MKLPWTVTMAVMVLLASQAGANSGACNIITRIDGLTKSTNAFRVGFTPFIQDAANPAADA